MYTLARREYRALKGKILSWWGGFGCSWSFTNICAGSFCVFTSTATYIHLLCVRRQWVLYNVKGCSCITVLYVFLHGSTSAVVQIQASSLTKVHCLLVEADHDPKQLQSLCSLSLSFQRSVTDHNIHITRVYSNNRDIWNARTPSRCCSQSVCKKSFGRHDIEIMWNAVSICKQDHWTHGGFLPHFCFYYENMCLWMWVCVCACVCLSVSVWRVVFFLKLPISVVCSNGGSLAVDVESSQAPQVPQVLTTCRESFMWEPQTFTLCVGVETWEDYVSFRLPGKASYS